MWPYNRLVSVYFENLLLFYNKKVDIFLLLGSRFYFQIFTYYVQLFCNGFCLYFVTTFYSRESYSAPQLCVYC